MSRSSLDSLTTSPFFCRSGAQPGTLDIVCLPVGSQSEPIAVWSRTVSGAGLRSDVIKALGGDQSQSAFVGRAALLFGPKVLDEWIDELVREAEDQRLKKREKKAQEARDRVTVNLYACNDKWDRPMLELKRRSETEAEWSIRYDRAIERDRMCDWLRWQKERFLDFLDHAREHGSESLSRMLTDEMFAAERRVKKEGRGAGGMRPLRMWRGD